MINKKVKCQCGQEIEIKKVGPKECPGCKREILVRYEAIKDHYIIGYAKADHETEEKEIKGKKDIKKDPDKDDKASQSKKRN